MLVRVCLFVVFSFSPSFAFGQDVPKNAGKTIIDGLLKEAAAEKEEENKPPPKTAVEKAQEEVDAAQKAVDDLPKNATPAERKEAAARLKTAKAALDDAKKKAAELERIAKAIRLQQEVVEQFIKAVPEEWFYGKLLNGFPVKEGGSLDTEDLALPTQVGRLANGGIVPQSATSFTLPNWRSFFSLGTESFVAGDFNMNGRTPFILIGTQKGVSGFESQKRLSVVFIPIDKVEKIKEKEKFFNRYEEGAKNQKSIDFWEKLPPVVEQQNPVNRAWVYNGSGAGVFLIMGPK